MRVSIDQSQSLATPRRACGFSLLELSVTIAVLLILAGGIFGVTTGAFELSSEMKGFQEENLRRQRLVDLLRSNFESLPGVGQVELLSVETNGAYQTYLSFFNHPAAFRFGAQASDVYQVVLATTLGTDGFLRVQLHYLDQEQSSILQRGDSSVLQSDASVMLSDRMKELSWRFYHPETEDYEDIWELRSGRPTLIECRFAFEGDERSETQVFWVPPRTPVAAPGGGPEIRQDDEGEENLPSPVVDDSDPVAER